MLIQYYGDYCFKITAKPGGRATEDIVIWTDPCGKASGLRAPQGQADIVLLSHSNGVDTELSGLKGTPTVFDMPGEYAAKGVNILGLGVFQDTVSGAERGQNTVFVLQSEGLNLCFLGALGHEPSPDHIEKINGADILFVPAGNQDTLPVTVLDDVIRKIEPKLIVPMHYKIPGLSLALDDETDFCGEVGNCPFENQARLNIRPKDIEGKSMEVVLLEKA